MPTPPAPADSSAPNNVRAMDVMVVGSVNVDLVVTGERLPAPGETVTGGRFSRHGGGKGANQAVAAARLGAAVGMAAAVGDDELGREALAALEAEGIDLGAVARLGRAPTGVALIVVDKGGENQIAVASGANAELGGEVADAVRAAAPKVVLLGHEVPEAAVLAGARAAPGTIVLNPAPARPIAAELLALGPILTPNSSEACELAGEADPEAAARTLAERSGAPVLVTVGARGALLVDGGDVTLLPAPSVDVADTTGAGDALNGALAAELARGATLEDAARFAVAAASLSTRRPGAREGMPTRAEL
jgi:ribokinase